jgi:hypothetical protein
MAKDAPRIEKPCRVCGDIMYCTPRREVCSKCRRIAERDGKRMRDKAATASYGKRHIPNALPL